MRVDFIANASHELRTPLASMLGFVETLQGSAHDDAEARDRFLAIMREQGRRMARLIDDLLVACRASSRSSTCARRRRSISRRSRAMSPTRWRRLPREMGVEIKFDADQPVVVTGDRDELVRVAENLIENAIKYGAPARTASSGRSRRDRGRRTRAARAALIVRDYGRGIAPEHLPRLTERFYRVDAGQSRAKNGTGLGLAIVKHILARHRGRLTIASRIGPGLDLHARSYRCIQPRRVNSS